MSGNRVSGVRQREGKSEGRRLPVALQIILHPTYEGCLRRKREKRPGDGARARGKRGRRKKTGDRRWRWSGEGGKGKGVMAELQL